MVGAVASMVQLSWAICVASLALGTHARTWSIEADGGMVPNTPGLATERSNAAGFVALLHKAQPGDVVLVPNRTYHTMGGLILSGIDGVTIDIQGTISYSQNIKAWPRSSSNQTLPCLAIYKSKNVKIISSTGYGTFDGNGGVWWGIPFIGYLQRGEDRPRLVQLSHVVGFEMANIHLYRSPYWTFTANTCRDLHIWNSNITARRDNRKGHSLYDLSAFNTDGWDFDHGCDNVWVHDSVVYNQDDCIAAKDGSTNMVFERITASGLGLTIGSIGDNNLVSNITFRDIKMPNTYKGIYMKFRGSGAVSNITYENIVMESPQQYSIWIGPSQQSDSKNPCAAHTCSLCWPTVPFSKCTVDNNGQYKNIVLRNIVINNPKRSPGLIFGNPKTPMQNVVFDNVVVKGGKIHKPFKDGYFCKGVQGVATGKTSPVPPCFEDRTDKTLR